MVGFRVALDSVNNGTLVRAAAHILCGTVRVKQVDRIRAAFNVTHLLTGSFPLCAKNITMNINDIR